MTQPSENTDLAQKIYNVISKQDFVNWFGDDGKFEKHIGSLDNAPTKEEIIQDIKKMFSI